MDSAQALKRQKKLSRNEQQIYDLLNVLFPFDISFVIISYQKVLFEVFAYQETPVQTFDPCNIIPQSQYLYLLPNKRLPVHIYSMAPNQLNLIQTFHLNIETKQNEVLKAFEITDRFKYYLYERSIIIQSNQNNQILINRVLPDTFGAINTSYCFKIDSDQVIYWTILAKHQIYYMNLSNVNKIERFGDVKSGSGRGEYNDPFDLTYDNENLYICDHGNYRIQVINKKSGEYQYHFGQKGKEPGDFNNSTRILLYEDILIVSEWYNLQFFNKFTGAFMYRIGKREKGEAPGEFDRIRGICILEEKLCVVDSTCRIQIFS